MLGLVDIWFISARFTPTGAVELPIPWKELRKRATGDIRLPWNVSSTLLIRCFKEGSQHSARMISAPMNCVSRNSAERNSARDDSAWMTCARVKNPTSCIVLLQLVVTLFEMSKRRKFAKRCMSKLECVLFSAHKNRITKVQSEN